MLRTISDRFGSACLGNVLQFIRKMTHHVFVYGTLKRNEPNHSWLTAPENGSGLFVCEAVTSAKYPLVIATRYNIPFLLFKPGTGHFVEGEVYQVDDLMLSKLDILEDHPNFYTRTIDVLRPRRQDPELPQTINCWVYFLQRFKPQLLELPSMQSYSSKGPHGREYAESNNESTPADLDEVIQDCL